MLEIYLLTHPPVLSREGVGGGGVSKYLQRDFRVVK